MADRHNKEDYVLSKLGIDPKNLGILSSTNFLSTTSDNEFYEALNILDDRLAHLDVTPDIEKSPSNNTFEDGIIGHLYRIANMLDVLDLRAHRTKCGRKTIDRIRKKMDDKLFRCHKNMKNYKHKTRNTLVNNLNKIRNMLNL